MQHLVHRLQQDRGSNLHGLPHCGGSDLRREFAWKTSQSRTCPRSARGTSIAWISGAEPSVGCASVPEVGAPEKDIVLRGRGLK